MKSLALVLIGDEILTGKVTDENGPFAIARCRTEGVMVRLVAVVPDALPAIGEALHFARTKADHVVTAGGIGPTHDDVTYAAVAHALGRPLSRQPELEARLRASFGHSPFPRAALKLVEVPAGSTLIANEELPRFSIVTCDGISMLAGVPTVFRSQFNAVLKLFNGVPVTLRVLFVAAREVAIAAPLEEVAHQMAPVAIGSYPTFDTTLDYQVKVTIEHADPKLVEETVERLRQVLPPGSIIREE